MNTTKEEMVTIIRIVDVVRKIREIQTLESEPIADLAKVIRTFADSPEVSNDDLLAILEAEVTATKLEYEKVMRNRQRKAQGGSVSQ